MRSTCHVLCVAACALFAWAGESQGSDSPVDTRNPQAKPFWATSRCFYDRVLIGPGGNDVTVWENDARNILGARRMLPPSNVIVGRMYGPDDLREDSFVLLGGSGLRLFPIRWSSEAGRLYVRVREPRERIFAVDPTGRKLEETPLSSKWRFTDVKATTHGDVALLNSPSVLRKVGKVDGKNIIRGSATIGRIVQLIGAKRDDLRLVVIKSNSIVKTSLSSGSTRLLGAHSSDRLYAQGISYLGAQRADEHPYVPYQRPIVDLETGKVAGIFGPTEIVLDRASEIDARVQRLNRHLRSEGGVVLDISESGQVLMALVSYFNGNRKLFRLGPDGISSKLVCKERKAGQSVHLKISAIDQNGADTGVKGAPLLLQYSVADGGRRDAIVLLHGGPGGTLADSFWAPPSLRLLKPGRDLIALEYSGSLGGGADLTKRLAEHGMESLTKDVEALVAWLSRRRYQKIYLLADSFGSVPAMLALSRHRSTFAATFQIAPLLKLQNARKWANTGNGLTPTIPDTQMAYELTAFGGADGRNRFADQLGSLAAEAKLGSNDHLYFGGLDQMSKPEHLPANARANVMVLPFSGHAALGGRDEVWRDIVRVLDQD